MRISDWSSDVCSSDLPSVWYFRYRRAAHALSVPFLAIGYRGCASDQKEHELCVREGPQANRPGASQRLSCRDAGGRHGRAGIVRRRPLGPEHPPIAQNRSEEHTSELQSLMRISYAVFCLKKKNTQPTIQSSLHTYEQKNI